MLVNGSSFYCGNGSSKPLQLALNSDVTSLKTSVSSGKSLVASAVTGKGVQTAADAPFQTIANNINVIPTGSYGAGTATVTVTGAAISKGDKVILLPETHSWYSDNYSVGTPAEISNGYCYSSSHSYEDAEIVCIDDSGHLCVQKIVAPSRNWMIDSFIGYDNNVYQYTKAASNSSIYYEKFDPVTGTFSSVTQNDANGSPSVGTLKTAKKLLEISYRRSSYSECHCQIITAIDKQTNKSCGIQICAHYNDSGRAFGYSPKIVDTTDKSKCWLLVPTFSYSYSYCGAYQFDSMGQICPTQATPFSSYNLLADGVLNENLVYYPFIGIAQSSGTVGSTIMVKNYGLYGATLDKDSAV